MKRLADQTLYEILEVAADAPQDEIEAALDRALALFAPGSLATYSLMAPEESELLTRRLEDARATLLDPERRARYDEALGAPERSGAPVHPVGRGELPPVIPALAPERPAGEAAPLAPVADVPAEEAGPPVGATAALSEDAVPVALATEARAEATPIALAAEVPAGVAAPIARATEAAAPAASQDPRDPPPALEVPRAPPAPSSPPIRLDRVVSLPPSPPRPTPPPLVAEPRPPLPVLPEGAPWTGGILRQVREARGISTQQIADRTRVTRHHIENIEADRFSALPAPVYLRGILLSLARELRLDGQKVARSYLDRVSASTGSKGR